MTICQHQKGITILVYDYIVKLLKKHGWLGMANEAHHKPVHFTNNISLVKSMEHTKYPECPKERRKLESTHGIAYCAVIGEAIYAMVTALPDI